jgi:hypothetical protein
MLFKFHSAYKLKRPTTGGVPEKTTSIVDGRAVSNHPQLMFHYDCRN